MDDHSRNCAIVWIGPDLSVSCVDTQHLTYREAQSWLESSHRAPSPHGWPVIMRHPLPPEIERLSEKPESRPEEEDSDQNKFPTLDDSGNGCLCRGGLQ